MMDNKYSLQSQFIWKGVSNNEKNAIFLSSWVVGRENISLFKNISDFDIWTFELSHLMMEVSIYPNSL